MSVTMKRKYATEETFPLSLEWIIKKDNLKVSSKTIPIPNLPNVSYHLAFNPKDGEDEGQSTIYFHLQSDKSVDITIDAVLLCKSANFKFDWTHTFKKDDEIACFGSRICYSVELLEKSSKFFVGNRMVVEIKGILKIENGDDEIEPKISKTGDLGLMLWESKAGKDVIIEVAGEDEIMAHKVVLHRRSAKFAELLDELDSDKKGKISPAMDRIIIEKSSLDTVKEAVLFCYDVQSAETLSAEDAASLLIFAHEYKIHDLKKIMEQFCVENISVSNACVFANTSIAGKACKLKAACLQFLRQCMKDGTAVKDIEQINDEVKDALFMKAFCAVCES